MFPEIVDYLTDGTFNEAINKNCYKFTSKFVLYATTIILSCLTNITVTYFNDKAFRPEMGESVLLLDIPTFAVWTTVSAWSLLAIPPQARDYFITYYPRILNNENRIKRLALLRRIDQIEQKWKDYNDDELNRKYYEIFEETSASTHTVSFLQEITVGNGSFERDSKKNLIINQIAGIFGAFAGVGSSVFNFPSGMQAGKLLARILRIQSSEVFLGYLVGTTSFTCQGLLSGLSAYSVFQKTFAATHNILIQSCFRNGEYIRLNGNNEALSPDNNVIIKNRYKDILLFLLAIFSSAHHIELTAEYIDPGPGRTFLIVLSIIGLSCINYWGMSKLYDQFSLPPLSQSRLTFFRRTAAMKDAIQVIEDNYIEDLYGTVVENEERVIELTSLSQDMDRNSLSAFS